LGYKIKEIFKSYQGEGFNAGTVAVFVRFAKCNLWSGSELDRKSSICQFCDTNFIGGAEYETATEVCDLVDDAWGGGLDNRVVILTGGEPLLCVDVFIASELKKRGYAVWVETNGTVAPKPGVRPCLDWVTVSPKAGTTMRIMHVNELKVVYPQHGLTPDQALEMMPTAHELFIQPKHPEPVYDDEIFRSNCDAAIAYCMANPKWRLSFQTHKITGAR